MSTRVLAADSLAAGSSSSAALLTLGISLYAIAILVCLGIAINAARFRRRRLAITMAWVVGILTIAGVVVAILSAVYGG
ncbi:hypothetical protein [Gordonia aurantiaca]|uniref:hypothetical protein n=1 Tax=Gordonia sp. B21 TaxID=3151852 RepID=UPI0032643E0F